MRLGNRGATLLCVLAATAGAELAVAQDRILALGKFRAQECTSCHRIDGVDNGIPAITGWDEADFISTSQFYRDGQRNNPAMVSVMQVLGEQDIRALARFFATLPRAGRGQSAPGAAGAEAKQP